MEKNITRTIKSLKVTVKIAVPDENSFCVKEFHIDPAAKDVLKEVQGQLPGNMIAVAILETEEQNKRYSMSVNTFVELAEQVNN